MANKRAKARDPPAVNLPSEQDKNLMRMRAARTVAEEMGVSFSLVVFAQPAAGFIYLFSGCLPQTSVPWEVLRCAYKALALTHVTCYELFCLPQAFVSCDVWLVHTRS